MKNNIKETTIYQGFVTNIQERNMSATTLEWEMLNKAVFTGMAIFLRDYKNTKAPVCLEITDYTGSMLMAAYCKYIQPVEDESDETAGSWLIDFTFNKDDIPENAKIVDIKEPACFNAMNIGSELCGFNYKIESDVIVVAIATVKSIIDWLDANASEDETASVEFDEVFIASVEVEKGEKVMGIVVDEELKTLTKGTGDDLLSRANVTAAE